MATLTIRLPDDMHERLKQLARSRELSINKLMEELSVAALAEFDAETRFRVRAARGNPETGLHEASDLNCAPFDRILICHALLHDLRIAIVDKIIRACPL